MCTLKIEGMTCSPCAARVEKEALKIEGVKAAKVSEPKGTAEVTFDASKTNPEAIAKSITDKTRFKAEVSGTKKVGSPVADASREGFDTFESLQHP